MKIDGSCHCGRVTYEAQIDPEKVMICHCTDCQTLSGSAFRSVALTIPGGFRLLSGELKTYVKTSDSGVRRPQTFCPECGSPIYSTTQGEGAKVFSIRAGTARQRRDLIPRTQIWCRSALPWLGEALAARTLDKQGDIPVSPVSSE